MAKIKQTHKVWRKIGGAVAFALSATLYVMTLMGAGRAVLGFALATFFIAFPLLFLSLAPPAKPGLDPLTAKYYHPWRTEKRTGPEPDGDSPTPF